MVVILPVMMASLLGSVYGGGAEAGTAPNAGIGTAGLRVGGEVEEVNGSMDGMFDVELSASLLLGVLDDEPESLRDFCWKKLLSNLGEGIMGEDGFEMVDGREWHREVSNINGMMAGSCLRNSLR